MGGIDPTVTDANAVLGYLPPRLAGGTLALDVAAARAAIERVLAGPLGLSVEAAALGVRAVANANMVRAIRAVTVERGLDPRALALLAFGGSGPVHACDLARTLGIGRVLFPPSPGVFTAMGMLAGAVEHHEVRPLRGRLDDLDGCAVAARRDEMRAAATAALVAQGYADDTIVFTDAIDLRLEGQDAALSIAFDAFDRAALRPAFLAAYREAYGYSPTDTVEAASLRLRAEARTAAPLDFAALKPVRAAASASSGPARPVTFARGGAVLTPVVARDDLRGPVAGPLIIEAPDTTIVIPPGARVAPNGTGGLMATLEAVA